MPLHRPLFAALPALLVLAACNLGGAESLGSTTTTKGAGGGGGSTTGGGGGAGGGGPVIRIHLRASTAPFPHSDGLSGQTPLAHSSGMRKFQLFKAAGDPSPLTVFDHGAGFVEAGYEGGADTVVATVDPKTLVPGHYTVGRVVHSHVRYRVAGTMHTAGLTLPGEFDDLEVLSDGTTLDGQTWNHGHYSYVFKTGGKSYPTSGEGAPVPEIPSTGGFSVKFENGEWAYYFPVNLTLVDSIPADVDMVMAVNMHECFRWQDVPDLGYQTGVFDTTATTFEPVKTFGANSFDVIVE